MQLRTAADNTYNTATFRRKVNHCSIGIMKLCLLVIVATAVNAQQNTRGNHETLSKLLVTLTLYTQLAKGDS